MHADPDFSVSVRNGLKIVRVPSNLPCHFTLVHYVCTSLDYEFLHAICACELTPSHIQVTNALRRARNDQDFNVATPGNHSTHPAPTRFHRMVCCTGGMMYDERCMIKLRQMK